MTTLTDIANDLDRYPLDETTVQIVEVTREGSSSDTAINANEKWKFKVKVTNNGHINMTGVSLHVFGMNGVLISETANGNFDAFTHTVGSLAVPGAGGTATTGFIWFKSPSVLAANTQLLNAHIFDWSGNFDHYFSNHTKNENDATVVYPRVTYSAQVHPA